MIETGLVAGYLALAVGPAPACGLRLDPTDRRRQESIAHALDRRARRDPKFARDLAGLTDRLDRAGGRRLLQDVWTSGPVTVGHGNSVQVKNGRDVAGRDINRVTVRHPAELHGKPALVHVGFWLSALLALSGFGLVGRGR